MQAIRRTGAHEIELLASLGQRVAAPDVLVTTLKSIDTMIEITLKNVSNAQTVGYKRRVPAIEGGFLRMVRCEFSSGEFHRTGRSLDLAIQGPGFFQIQMPDGKIVYTRNGMFLVNASGKLVNSSGYPLLDGLTIPAGLQGTEIMEDGSVFHIRVDGIQWGSDIQLAVFRFPEHLETHSDTLFAGPGVEGGPITGTPGTRGIGKIHAGFLEKSNVNMTQELLSLQTLLRWKQGIQRAILALNG